MMQSFLLYIDPGSGSYILQMIIAAVLGLGFFFKNFWLTIKSYFTGKKTEEKRDNDRSE